MIDGRTPWFDVMSEPPVRAGVFQLGEPEWVWIERGGRVLKQVTVFGFARYEAGAWCEPRPTADEAAVAPAAIGSQPYAMLWRGLLK